MGRQFVIELPDEIVGNIELLTGFDIEDSTDMQEAITIIVNELI